MDGERARPAALFGRRVQRSVLVAAHLLAGAWVLLAVLLLFWTRAPALVGLQTRVVSSGSMQPALGPGDLVVIAPPASTPVVGDVLQVSDPSLPSGYYLHRVVGVEAGGTLVTRGDANPVDDPAVPLSAVDGRLLLAVPRLGTPLHQVTTGHYAEPLAAVAFALAGAGLLVRPRGRRSAQ